jgi:hypothetical protein
MSADPLEAAIAAGAVAALRRRAEAIRARASANITILDRPPVRIVTSESATNFASLATSTRSPTRSKRRARRHERAVKASDG